MDNPYHPGHRVYAQNVPEAGHLGGFKNQNLSIKTEHARFCDIEISSRYSLGAKNNARYEVKMELGGATHEFVAKLIAFAKGESYQGAPALPPKEKLLPPGPIDAEFIDDEPISGPCSSDPGR